MVPALGDVVFRVRLRRDLDEEFGRILRRR